MKICLLFVKPSKLDMIMVYLMYNTNEDLVIVCENSKLNIMMAYLMKKTCWTWGGPVMKV